ncbi:MAG TPA: phosphoribosylamine--glycine ligase [Nannocystaceae bacterium]|nr:phosphoribosylamine--glycine ligase [Nannocystaceae bacterium]
MIGSGGREHALAWKLAQDGADVIVAPGNDGIAQHAECVAMQAGDAAALVTLAKQREVGLVVVGPEQPLVDGLADALRDARLPCFGPSAAAARLEGSKVDAKRFMQKHGIPTATAVTVTAKHELAAALARFDAPPVVKADGLAAGKGVTVAESFDEAEHAVLDCLERGVFGSAGAQVVLEQRLVGQEVSFFALTDGAHAVTLPPAQDHKRIGEHDTGPNTGGMGAYAPAPIFDARVRAKVIDRIVAPTLAGLRAEGRAFNGALFVGLMIDPQGEPWVIEYNCRFGDPEVQALVFGLDAPLLPVLHAAAIGELSDGELHGRAAATVVLAAAGYPGTPRRGDAIHGLDEARAVSDALVFHAGTRRADDGGFESAGGRVLGVCGRGDDLERALARAYQAASCISFAGMQLRRDVGARALGRAVG